MTDAAITAAPVRKPSNAVLQALRRNRFSWIGIGLLAAIIFAAIFAPLLSPYDPLKQHILDRLQAPSAEFWLGTDSYGRDVLSRLLYGARISLSIGFLSVMVAMVVGSTIGILAGYIGGLFDQIVMGLVDVMLSFPTLLLGLMVAAMLGASFENLIIAITTMNIGYIIAPLACLMVCCSLVRYWLMRSSMPDIVPDISEARSSDVITGGKTLGNLRNAVENWPPDCTVCVMSSSTARKCGSIV